MKTHSSFSSMVAQFVLVGGLVLPVLAQPGAAGPEAPAVQSPKPPPSADPTVLEESDSGGRASPQASRQGSDDFVRTDTDRDGRISAKEYAASELAALDLIADGRRQGSETTHGGFSLSRNEDHPEQSKYFRRLDADGDGFISREEFAAKRRGGTERQPEN